MNPLLPSIGSIHRPDRCRNTRPGTHPGGRPQTEVPPPKAPARGAAAVRQLLLLQDRSRHPPPRQHEKIQARSEFLQALRDPRAPV